MNANSYAICAPGRGSAPVHVERKAHIRQAQWLTELNGCPFGYIPLDQETRTHVSTRVMCHHLGRKETEKEETSC